MADNDIKFDLDLAVRNFDNGLKKANKSLDRFSDDFKKQSKGNSAAWGSFVGNIAAIGLTSAIAGLGKLASAFGDVGRQALENAAIQEAAINDLNVALRGAGAYSAEASEDFQKFASQLQTTSIYGDELLLKTAALGSQMAKLSGEDLKDATQAAADMASALNIDLNTAMTLIAKSSTDSGSGLKRYGVVVQKGATDAETLANAIKSVNEKFSGSAAGKIRTYEGAMTQASNSFGDMLENIGGLVTKNPVVILIINKMSKLWETLGKMIDKNKGSIQNFIKKGVLNLIKSFKFLVDYINPVYNAMKAIGNIFLTVKNISDVWKKAVIGAWISVGKTILGAIDGLIGYAKKIPKILLPKSWEDGLDNFKTGVGSAQKKLEEFAKYNKKELRRELNELKSALKNLGKSFVNSISDKDLAAVTKKLDLFAEQVANAKERIEKDGNNDSGNGGGEDKVAKRKLSDTKIFWKKMIGTYKKGDDTITDQQEKAFDERVKTTNDSLGRISTLTQSSNRKLFELGKASAIAQAIIDGASGVMKAWSLGPILGPVMAGLVATASAVQIQKISETKFNAAEGGIVPGSKYAGDTVTAGLNSRELVLNMPQQARLFNIANGGGALGGNGEVVSAIDRLGMRIAQMEIKVYADDNEIAKSASRGVQNGVQIGVSR